MKTTQLLRVSLQPWSNVPNGYEFGENYDAEYKGNDLYLLILHNGISQYFNNFELIFI